MDGVVVAAQAEHVIAVRTSFTHEFLQPGNGIWLADDACDRVLRTSFSQGFLFVGRRERRYEKTYVVQLDEGTNHAGAKSALLAWCDVVGHVRGFRVVGREDDWNRIAKRYRGRQRQRESWLLRAEERGESDVGEIQRKGTKTVDGSRTRGGAKTGGNNQFKSKKR